MVEKITLYETIADKSPAFKNHYFDFIPEKKHLELSGYEPHRGLRLRSQHWRKEKDKGCYHITIHKNRGTRIHWDAWDPRKHPIKHFFEILHRFLIIKLIFKKN